MMEPVNAWSEMAKPKENFTQNEIEKLKKEWRALQDCVKQQSAVGASFWRNYLTLSVRIHEHCCVQDGNKYIVPASTNIEQFLQFAENNNPESFHMSARIFEYVGELDKAAGMYGQIVAAYPQYENISTILMHACGVMTRINLPDSAAEYMQRVLDYPPSPYSEADIMIFLSGVYELCNTKESKKLSKEALRQGYKKLLAEGRVKRKNSNDAATPLFSDEIDQNHPVAKIAFTDKTNGGDYISYKAWKKDYETWEELGDLCSNNKDYSFAIDMYTKALWTPKGQVNGNLWLKLGDLHYLMNNIAEAIQAASTAFTILPNDLQIRSRLGRWDEENWGYHIQYEEKTATMVQARLRGNWGRVKAREHKRIVLAFRRKRNLAAIEIQRTVARGVQARERVKQIRYQRYLEWQQYQLELLRYNSAVLIQCMIRCFQAKKLIKNKRIERDAATTIQCFVRRILAKVLLDILKKEKLERDMRVGAISLQRIYRGYRDRRIVDLLRTRRNAAVCIQCAHRCYISRLLLADKRKKYFGAKELQRIYRGYKLRKKYKTIRGDSACLVQKIYRGYVLRTSFPIFRSSYYKHKEKIKHFNPIVEKVNRIHDAFDRPESEQKVTEDETTASNAIRPLCTDVKHANLKRPLRSKSSNQCNETDWVGSDLYSTRAVNASESARIIVDALLTQHVSKIWVSNWEVDDSCMQQLEVALQSNQSLTELAIGDGAQITAKGMDAFSEALRCHNFRLRKIQFINQKELGDSGAMPLVNCICDFFYGRYAKLEELCLQNVGLGDSICYAMSEGLGMNTKLKRLRLSYNKIKDDGAISLSKALRENISLQVLDLSHNRIGSIGGSSLGIAVFQNKDSSLRNIRLQGNFIGNIGALALEKITSFCVVSIQFNPIQPRVIKRIKLRGQSVEYQAQQKSTIEHLLPPVQCTHKNMHQIEVKGPPFTKPPLIPNSPDFGPSIYSKQNNLRKFNPRPYKEQLLNMMTPA